MITMKVLVYFAFAKIILEMNTSTIASQHSLFPRGGIPINQVNDPTLSRPLQINDKHYFNSHCTFKRIPKRRHLYPNRSLEQKSVAKNEIEKSLDHNVNY